ncbi:MAG: HAD family hydrolase [Candidatus Levybacteria bacterium]|nr:HAD family hydrolase [Candidatus Levybacteria bacterium]
MKYKALMLDVDGTIIPYQYTALPSQEIADAIHLARNKGVTVCLVTGRSYPSTKRILEYLNITKGYVVVDGGALVYNLEKKRPLYERYIEEKDLEKIISVFDKENVPFYVKDKFTIANRGDQFKLYSVGQKLDQVSMIFTDELFSLDKTHKLLKRLSFPNITVLRTKHKDPNKYAFNITHLQATKLHGIEVLCKELGIKRSEIIGVGDGYNDFPLLMASGLKVAMGNAIEDLKEIADFVAPSVTDNGVATVIEKYLLKD